MDRTSSNLWGIDILTALGWTTIDRVFFARASAEQWVQENTNRYRHPPRIVRYERAPEAK
jgi:hypothetical protein